LGCSCYPAGRLPETGTPDPSGPCHLLLPAHRRSKYELQHVVRTNLAANDTAFNCVFEVEDEAGVRGVRLGKELMGVAGARPGEGRFRR
jgi:hypothetical protein